MSLAYLSGMRFGDGSRLTGGSGAGGNILGTALGGFASRSALRSLSTFLNKISQQPVRLSFYGAYPAPPCFANPSHHSEMLDSFWISVGLPKRGSLRQPRNVTFGHSKHKKHLSAGRTVGIGEKMTLNPEILIKDPLCF